MSSFVEFLDSNESITIFGVTLVGINGVALTKVALSLLVILVITVLSNLARRGIRLITGPAGSASRFWTKQGVQIVAAVLLTLLLLSVWVTPGTDLSTGLGLLTAGLAFALQKVITALAGYFVILRGQIFFVGDRVDINGVRGDVVSLGFLRTTVMEMGAPSSMQSSNTGNWISSRQFTGRLVTVTNAAIFDEPVYNYTSGFPFLWEEINVNVAFDVDIDVAENILLSAATDNTEKMTIEAGSTMDALRKRYAISVREFSPQVFLALKEDWIQLTVRFVVRPHGARSVKDRISRRIVLDFRAAGITLANVGYDLNVTTPASAHPVAIPEKTPRPAQKPATGTASDLGSSSDGNA